MSTVTTVQPAIPLGVSQLAELRGLVAAFKAIAYTAADEKIQERDPIDWTAVQELAERATLLVFNLEAEATGGAQ